MTELEITQHAKKYLDNLDAIIAINATPLHENQGKPWEPEEDAYCGRRHILA